MHRCPCSCSTSAKTGIVTARAPMSTTIRYRFVIGALLLVAAL